MTDRDSLKSALQDYTPLNSTESAFVPKFSALLEYPNCYERSLLHGHLTASCWVLDNDLTSVLMLHHAKLDKWLQPGGHADGDENLINVAQKELVEETALSDFTLFNESIFDLDIHTIPERKGVAEHEHYDVRFAFRASPHAEISGNHESKGLAWVALDQTPDEESIQRMVKKTKRLG